MQNFSKSEDTDGKAYSLLTQSKDVLNTQVFNGQLYMPLSDLLKGIKDISLKKYILSLINADCRDQLRVSSKNFIAFMCV